jgi:hypothetical protein
MKKQLLKKLSAFIILIVIGIMFSASANAQIIYTDVIPDALYNVINDSCYLDLDNNGQADFKLYRSEVPQYCGGMGGCALPLPEQRIKIDRVGTNEIAYVIPWGGSTVSSQWPQSLSFGQMIDANSDMSETNHMIRRYRSGGACSGGGGAACVPDPPITWALSHQAYLGLRFDIAGATHYGWARLNVSSATSFTLMDYAYNSIPNQPILAGQTIATGINENSFTSSISLFPNPATNHLTITLGNNAKKVEVTITDITGKVIYTIIESDKQRIEVNTQNFAAGIYVVQIQAADSIASKKLVVEK